MKEWVEIGGFVVVILSVLVNIALSVFGRPKTISEISDKLSCLIQEQEYICKQLKAQWEKIDLHSEILVKYGQELAILKDRWNREINGHRKEEKEDE